MDDEAIGADQELFPNTTPLTDYGEVVAPLIFEKLLAIRWGFEPSHGFANRLKEEMDKCPVNSEQAEILKAIQQNLPNGDDEQSEPEEAYDNGKKGMFEEGRQTGYGHEIGGMYDPDPDDYE